MKRNKSIDAGALAMIPRADIPRSSFTANKTYKTTFDAGYLIPVLCDEALPDDTFNVNMTAFARMAVPLHPIMDNLYLDSFFFCPNRLLWKRWPEFMGHAINKDESDVYVVPHVVCPLGGYEPCSLQDYMGLPTKGQIKDKNVFYHNVLWTRAYNLIWNEWFRDENLQEPAVVDLGDDGTDLWQNYHLRRRGKRKDYFTSCLPWPQKGGKVSIFDTDQSIPISTNNLAPQFYGYSNTEPSVKLQSPIYADKEESNCNSTG